MHEDPALPVLTVMETLGRWALWAALVIVVLCQLALIVHFLVRCWKKSEGSGRAKKAWDNSCCSTATLVKGDEQRHQNLLSQETHRFDTLLVVGSLGLAAWSQLFVSSGGPPGSHLSGQTLGLLFAGSFCLIAGSLVWRSEGLYLTLLGRRATLQVGYTLIALALASVVFDLELKAGSVACLALVVLIAVREIAEGFDAYKLQKKLIFPAAADDGTTADESAAHNTAADDAAGERRQSVRRERDRREGKSWTHDRRTRDRRDR